MTSIQITDRAGLKILTATAGPGSGISKYFSGQTAGFIASAELAQALNKPVTSFTAGPVGVGMTFADAGTFGTSGVKWKFALGETVTVHVTQPGGELPGESDFGHPVIAGDSEALVSVTFTPSLSVGLAGGIGELQFGFTGGGSVAFRAGGRFSIADATPTLGDALKALLARGVVPANALDIAVMQEGDISSVSGEGSLQFSAEFDVARSFNPMVSVNLPLKQVGEVQLVGGASLKVKAKVSFKGAYQIRVHKVAGDRVRVGYYKAAQTSAEFGVDASLGLSLTVGKREVLERVMGMLGAPKADVKELVDAGLTDEQIDHLVAAVKASLDRSIAVSLSGSFLSASSKSKMFEFEFDLDGLGADGMDALNHAIRGDLSAVTADALPQGVRLLASEIKEMKKRRMVWKLNLLGIVNVLRISELIRQGSVLFNAETGELTVTDSISAKKIRVETRPLEADTRKLHKMLLQTLIFTAAHRASGAQEFNSKYGASMTYFEQDASVNRQKVADYLDNFVGLGLATVEEKGAFLATPFRGRSSVFIDAVFDDTAFRTMFLNGAGKARPVEEYEGIGRAAIAKLIQPGDPNEFRRTPMLAGTAASDDLWKRMSSAGQPSFAFVLPAGLNSGPALGIIVHDYTVIKWWANSMAKASKVVAELRKFVHEKTRTPAELAKDAKFLKLRDKLTDALSDVASDALPDFLDAWGVLVMDDASNRKAEVTGILLIAGPIMTKTRP